jgi:hypothetical protein
VWWARKAEDASSSVHSHEPILDDELLETDEEDNGQHATESEGVTNVPLPTATDVTQASVHQLSALAVNSQDDEPSVDERSAATTPATETAGPTAGVNKDAFAPPASSS